MKNLGISQHVLKIIALITMLIDHLGAVVVFMMIKQGGHRELYDLYKLLRIIGRTAFPIYCVLTVEGFVHTRNLKRYLGMIAIFAVISEIPFNLSLGHGLLWYPNHQNVFMTLFIGILMMTCIKRTYERFFDIELQSVIVAIVIAAGYLLSYFLKTDYAGSGALAIVCTYIVREHVLALNPSPLNDRLRNVVLILICCSILGACSKGAYEGWCFLAVPFFALYNGERGKYLSKMFYYWIYPAHLIVFWLITSYFYGL